MNGTPPSALRLTPAKAPAAPPAEEESLPPEGGTITLDGPSREAFKALLGGHECKLGDQYTVTAVSPESITLEITEGEYEEPAAEAPASAPAAGGKSTAMTYA